MGPAAPEATVGVKALGRMPVVAHRFVHACLIDATRPDAGGVAGLQGWWWRWRWWRRWEEEVVEEEVVQVELEVGGAEVVVAGLHAVQGLHLRHPSAA